MTHRRAAYLAWPPGQFYRALRLPDAVDHEKAESSYSDGVLTVTFPKKESKKARTIAIEAS